MKRARKPKIQRRGVLLVDDHPIMRQGLAQLIGNETDLEVFGEAETAAEAVERVAGRAPDLVLLDISLPGRSGLELIKDLQAIRPGIPILVISMHDEGLYAERVLRAGGRGYIMKQEGGKKLLTAIRQVLRGEIYVSEKMSSRILEIFSGRRGESASPIERLSDREFEVFQLLGQGKGTRQVAAELHLSAKTVEVHRSHIKEKLKLSSGAEVVHFAIRWVESQP